VTLLLIGTSASPLPGRLNGECAAKEEFDTGSQGARLVDGSTVAGDIVPSARLPAGEPSHCREAPWRLQLGRGLVWKDRAWCIPSVAVADES